MLPPFLASDLATRRGPGAGVLGFLDLGTLRASGFRSSSNFDFSPLEDTLHYTSSDVPGSETRQFGWQRRKPGLGRRGGDSSAVQGSLGYPRGLRFTKRMPVVGVFKQKGKGSGVV